MIKGSNTFKEITCPYPDNNCFFCGEDNKEGLKLRFFWDETKQEVFTEYLPVQYFIGQGKILHGGIQMGILDEIMGWTSYVFTKQMAVTSDLKIKFSKPVYVSGKKIKATCRVSSQKRTMVTMIAELVNVENDVCTTATGTYHILKKDKYEAVIHGQ